jgi:hypothetical protein
MKEGDLVKKVSPWTQHNPWMKFPDDEAVGLIVKTFGHNNHHCIVLFGDKEIAMSKTKLEVANAEKA